MLLRRLTIGQQSVALASRKAKLVVQASSMAAAAPPQVAGLKRVGLSPCGQVSVTSVQDGGNIEVVSMASLQDVQLRMIPEPYCAVDGRAHMQWFSFRVSGALDKPLSMSIINAGQASYAHAWADYRACASYDLTNWFRVPTQWEPSSGHLTIQHTPQHSSCSYAYFAPYPMTRHDTMIAKTQMEPGVELRVLGHSLDGRPMDLLQIGEPGPGKRSIWVIARQHPGETMAEFFTEGLLARLTDAADPTARALRAQAVFYCIPNMCPDGSARGHLRTNAVGFNLNRAWAAPDKAINPEVFFTLNEMKRTGVDLLMDVHGDEAIPYNFVAGNEGIPGYTPRLHALEEQFKSAFVRHSPDFQTKYGYPQSAPGQANLTVCSKAIGQLFDCLSFTLEQPFKDANTLPDLVTGWSPQRAARLGHDMLGAILEVTPALR